MRIIAGSLKGRKLAAVRGPATRPTSDRVREALFNILGPRCRDARVLDLFAGTGALGIEAISRGARRAVFVESAAPALTVLRKNLSLCHLEARSQVIQCNVLDGLKTLRLFCAAFDLVFMDPPYGRGMIAPSLRCLAESRALAPKALIVVEHAPGEPIDPVPVRMLPSDVRRYGQTQLSFFDFCG